MSLEQPKRRRKKDGAFDSTHVLCLQELKRAPEPMGVGQGARKSERDETERETERAPKCKKRLRGKSSALLCSSQSSADDLRGGSARSLFFFSARPFFVFPSSLSVVFFHALSPPPLFRYPSPSSDELRDSSFSRTKDDWTSLLV